MNKQQALKLIEGFNNHIETEGGQSPYRAGSYADRGHDVSRRINLRMQLELAHEYPNAKKHGKVSEVDWKASSEYIIKMELELDAWFRLQDALFRSQDPRFRS